MAPVVSLQRSSHPGRLPAGFVGDLVVVVRAPVLVLNGHPRRLDRTRVIGGSEFEPFAHCTLADCEGFARLLEGGRHHVLLFPSQHPGLTRGSMKSSGEIY